MILLMSVYWLFWLMPSRIGSAGRLFSSTRPKLIRKTLSSRQITVRIAKNELIKVSKEIAESDRAKSRPRPSSSFKSRPRFEEKAENPAIDLRTYQTIPIQLALNTKAPLFHNKATLPRLKQSPALKCIDPVSRKCAYPRRKPSAETTSPCKGIKRKSTTKSISLFTRSSEGVSLKGNSGKAEMNYLPISTLIRRLKQMKFTIILEN